MNQEQKKHLIRKIPKYALYGVILYIVIQGILAFNVWNSNMREMAYYKQMTIEYVNNGELPMPENGLEKDLEEQRTYFVMKAGFENTAGKGIVNGWLRGFFWNSVFIIVNHEVFRPFGLGY